MAELAASAFMALTAAAPVALEAAAVAAPAALSTVAETAAVAGSSLATAVPAAASTVAGASSLSSILSTLQGGMSVASSVSTLLGGLSGFQDSRNKARFADIDAEGERFKAEDSANRIKREMLQRVGDARVAYAASGQDVSGAGDIEASLRSQAAHETELALTSGQIRRAGGLAKAASLRSQGVAGLIGSGVKAGGQLAGYGLDLVKRG